MDLLLVIQALLGIAVFVAIAVVLSEQRSLPKWRLLVAGLGLQFLFAFAESDPALGASLKHNRAQGSQWFTPIFGLFYCSTTLACSPVVTINSVDAPLGQSIVTGADS